jgi:hypothetical protein
MTIIEIAELLGIYYPTAKRHIRAIEKSGIAAGDYKMTCTVGNMTVHSQFYGLEMIVALAFRIDTRNADIFRQWLIERAMQPTPKYQPPITVLFQAREQALPN